MVKLSNFSYKYRNSSQDVLSNIDLEITKGEVIVLLGRSGSGKSTLLKIISSLILTDSKVNLSGTDIWKKSPKKVIRNTREKMGFSFQNPSLQFFKKTIREEIIYDAIRAKIDKDLIENKLKELLILLNINEKLLDESPIVVSSGQQRKVSIASSLLSSPSTIFLDEPTVNLDDYTVNDLETFIASDFLKDETIIIATHDIDFCYSIATRVIVLDKGTILVDLPFKDFFSNKKNYSSIFNTPMVLKKTKIVDINKRRFINTGEIK